jgi:PST family polysaccharide transporter
VLSPRRWFDIGRLSVETTRRMLHYSLPLGPANALHWVSRRGDNLLVSAMFGPAAAGQYNLAYNLADIPATHIGEHIGDVLMPSFAKMDKPARRRRALVRAAGLLALVVFPAAVGLGVLAPTLVRAAFDRRWWDIGPMLVVLSMLSVLRPLGWLVGSYLQAVQRTRVVLLLEAIKSLAIVVLVLALGQLGLLWACAGVGVAYGAHAVGSVWVVKRDDRIPMKVMLATLRRRSWRRCRWSLQ